MENNEKPKSIIIRVGHILLFIIGIFIVISGAVLYYLIYTNKADIEQAVKNDTNAVVEVANDNFDKENTSVAEIIGDVVESSNTVNNTTITTSDASSRKVQNENLIVLYDGLLLDVAEMKQVDLKYIDSTNYNKMHYYHS